MATFKDSALDFKFAWPCPHMQRNYTNSPLVYTVLLQCFSFINFSCLSPIFHSKSFVDSLIAATAAKLLQSCQTLCNPIDGSPPGSPIPGILQARTLEGVAISFSNAWKWSHSVVSDSSRPHGLQPTRLLRPWDFPGKSTGVGCQCLLQIVLLCWHKMEYLTLGGRWCLSYSFSIGRLLSVSPNSMWTMVCWTDWL